MSTNLYKCRKCSYCMEIDSELCFSCFITASKLKMREKSIVLRDSLSFSHLPISIPVSAKVIHSQNTGVPSSRTTQGDLPQVIRQVKTVVQVSTHADSHLSAGSVDANFKTKPVSNELAVVPSDLPAQKALTIRKKVSSSKKKNRAKPKIFKPQLMNDDGKPSLGGLGNIYANEGQILGRSKKAGMTIRYEIAPCSCAGENSNCFKCDGTGYYRREILEEISHPENKISNFVRLDSLNKSPSENRFSNDSRGGIYSIREKGRFSSNPLYDDYDN